MINVLVDIILLLAIISCPCQCADSQFSCLPDKPFKTKDITCADFSEICVKTGDPECQSFLGTCQQCPPLNTTVKTFLDLLKALKDVLEKKVEVTVLQQRNLEKRFNEIAATSVAIITVMVISWFILIATLIIEVRFKLITKLCENCTKTGNKRQYRKVKNEKYKSVNNFPLQQNSDGLRNMIKEIFDSKFQQHSDKLDNMINEKLEKQFEEKHNHVDQVNKGHSKSEICFRVSETEEPIELYVTSYDNVVEIKRQICTKYFDTKLNYKQMQLKHKDRILDDNQYLLSNMESIHDIVQCEINNAIKPNDIIVLKVNGNMKIPGLIQVKRNSSIDDLKQIMSSFNNSIDIKIFKGTSELKDSEALKKAVLKTGDSIRVIELVEGHFIMHSIVGDTDPILVEYSNFDQISSLKKTLKEKLPCPFDEVILYYKGTHLSNEKFIFDLEIPRGSDIEYWRLLKLDSLKVSEVSTGNGRASTMWKATDISSNKDIFIKMFQFKRKTNWKESKAIYNELRKYKLTRSHPRFSQLNEFYFDEDKFCVEFEYLEGHTIREYASQASSSLQEMKIAKWSKQILEGLQALHKHKAVYRDLKSSNIFLDAEDNIKISVFGLSKYLNSVKNYQLEGLIKHSSSTTRYPCPDEMNNNPIDTYTDVWSFGAILSKMITSNNHYNVDYDIIHAGDHPYQKIPPQDWKNESNQEFDIQFNTDVTLELQNFIKCCLKINPKDRPTVDELLRDGFMKMNGL